MVDGSMVKSPVSDTDPPIGGNENVAETPESVQVIGVALAGCVTAAHRSAAAIAAMRNWIFISVAP